MVFPSVASLWSRLGERGVDGAFLAGDCSLDCSRSTALVSDAGDADERTCRAQNSNNFTPRTFSNPGVCGRRSDPVDAGARFLPFRSERDWVPLVATQKNEP